MNLLVNSSPDLLLSGEGQWDVDAVEGHPVDVALPVVPLPKGEGVAVHANILVKKNKYKLTP